MVRDIPANGRGNDAGTGLPRVVGEGGEFACVGGIRTCDDENRARAAISGDKRLVTQAGVAVQFLAALCFHGFGHITQHQDDFVRDVQTGVGIIPRPGGRRDG